MVYPKKVQNYIISLSKVVTLVSVY